MSRKYSEKKRREPAITTTAAQIFEDLEMIFSPAVPDIQAYLDRCTENWLSDETLVFLHFENAEETICMKKEEYEYLNQENYQNWYDKKYE